MKHLKYTNVKIYEVVIQLIYSENFILNLDKNKHNYELQRTA